MNIDNHIWGIYQYSNNEYCYVPYFFRERMNYLKIKDYGFPVFRILNQWQVTLFRSYNIRHIDDYVSVDRDGNYKFVYVYKRSDIEELLTKFKKHELEMGDYVVKYNGEAK
mgnify:CR=1 FL=1